MLKELAQYIVGLSTPQTVDINGMQFSDRNLKRYDYHTPEPLYFKSITGLINYIADNHDCLLNDCFIHIKSHARIEFLSPLNDDNEREIYAICEPDRINIQFDKFIEREAFNIMLQTGFVENDELKDILRYIGSMSDKAVRTVGDDGISQEVTIKSSTQGLVDVFIPNPVVLKPYRSFTEIEPVESKFVLRLKEGGYCALFEADGGAWRIDTMHALEDYVVDLCNVLEIDIKVFA